MKRDDFFWDSIRTTFNDHLDAVSHFEQMLKDYPVKAKNPFVQNRPLTVIFDPPAFVDHCLFKAPECRPKYADYKRNPEHFQPDRAERMRWMRECLWDPDFIVMEINPKLPRDQAKAIAPLLYLAETPNDEILKCVLEPTKPGVYRFISFYPVEKDNPAGRSKLEQQRMTGITIYKRRCK